MSESSPSDLAVAFRSFARRLSDAVADAEGDPERTAAAQAAAGPLESAISRAAAALGVPETGDAAAVGASVANRITTTAPDQWDESVLATLRACALEAGQALRAASAAAKG